jgi:hypothetical protein
MSIVVKGNHPLAEIIACKLFGIERVPRQEMDKLVNRACFAATKYQKEEEKEIAKYIRDNICKRLIKDSDDWRAVADEIDKVYGLKKTEMKRWE